MERPSFYRSSKVGVVFFHLSYSLQSVRFLSFSLLPSSFVTSRTAAAVLSADNATGHDRQKCGSCIREKHTRTFRSRRAAFILGKTRAEWFRPKEKLGIWSRGKCFEAAPLSEYTSRNLHWTIKDEVFPTWALYRKICLLALDARFACIRKPAKKRRFLYKN